MSKLPTIGTSIFSVMSKLANDYNAINLSQGFPNFDIDAKLKTIYKEVIDKDVHQYAPMPGNPLLLEQIETLVRHNYGRECDPTSELLVTAGATQGIFTCIQAFIHHKDEVVILDPCYDCYDPAILLAGGKAIHVPLSNEYLPDWNKIEVAMSSKTKMLIINNPHNPSGRVWNMEDFSSLQTLLSKYPKVLLLSDEVYEYITFEKIHISINSIEALLDRSIIISSFGKTFHITGWKMGYLIAPEHLMKELKKIHQYLVFSVNSVAQYVLSEYLKSVNVNELGAFYQKKRDLFTELMNGSKFKLLPSDGTYFQLADYSEISDIHDVEFTKELVTKFGVATIPVSVFNQATTVKNHIRFCFAKTDETLIKAAELLCKI